MSERPKKPPPPYIHVECDHCRSPINDGQWTCRCREWYCLWCVFLFVVVPVVCVVLMIVFPPR